MFSFIPVMMFLVAAIAVNTTAEEAGVQPPKLSESRDYAEYWEQQFYFETGSLLTSQFLITNLPISKHHGLMIASLKLPGEPAVVIKNGRSRDGWNFDGGIPQLTIFQHELKGRPPGYMLQLHNTTAEVDALFNPKLDPIVLVEEDNDMNLPTISLYAPDVRAFARWRPGPEIGGQGPDGDWLALGHGTGYALHVRQDVPLGRVLRRWIRVTPIDNNGPFTLILHHFATPSERTRTEAILVPRFGKPARLEGVGLEGLVAEGRLKINGSGFQGAITPEEELETFLIADQLNGFEKLVAGSLANISRYRWLASYELEGTLHGRPYSLAGTAILEEILVGEEKKNRRRRRR